MQNSSYKYRGTECETGPGCGVSNWRGERSRQLDILIKTPSLTQWLKLGGINPWNWAQLLGLCSRAWVRCSCSKEASPPLG